LLHCGGPAGATLAIEAIDYASLGIHAKVGSLLTGEQIVAKGTVKWFNPTKGYGFIQPSGGGKDVFVHISAVERAGLSTLNEGQTVEFEEVSNRGKTSAENLKVG
jgi:CspA family cold shock protein